MYFIIQWDGNVSVLFKKRKKKSIRIWHYLRVWVFSYRDLWLDLVSRTPLAKGRWVAEPSCSFLIK